MKSTALATTAIFFIIAALSAKGQGTFVYDQQSAIEGSGGEGAPVIQSNPPIGQSFTPVLDSVGFIRLWLYDNTQNNGLGATVRVDLHSGSITGPILASSSPIFMPDSFGRGSNAYVNFLFSTPASVTPGATYFFAPVVQSGDLWHIIDDPNYNYPGGTAIGGGQPVPPFDLWFREGIVVAEPSGVSLILLGIGIFVWRQRRCRKS